MNLPSKGKNNCPASDPFTNGGRNMLKWK